MNIIPVGIAGLGKHLPEQRITNADLEKIVDTTDEWIVQRTGIRERRRAAETEVASDLATAAARQALEDGGIKPEEVDLIVCCTVTGDQAFPATACQVAENLGATNAGGWDLGGACSGYVFGAQVAANTVASGAMKTVVVIGVEVLTRVTDYQDRNTCILFGDGAGAAVFTSLERAGGMEYMSGSQGISPDREVIQQPGGGSRMPSSHASIDGRMHYLKMEGRRTYKFAVKIFADLVDKALAPYGKEKLDLVIPHQVNLRIIEAAAERLDLPMDSFFINLDKYGNTSAASVPIAMREAKESGRLQQAQGKLVCLVAFGAGLSYGHVLLRI